ncbi:Protein kinase domain-containing protein [Mycena venus]|uniref:Protein kinase domain-containing protein n=1 Tax=Mycena venus TaxID=2733690 RepID=A0A8H6XJ83_9AGAR|nr:Protein kinase domain-containing protein [Mycena venus]
MRMPPDMDPSSGSLGGPQSGQQLLLTHDSDSSANDHDFHSSSAASGPEMSSNTSGPFISGNGKLKHRHRERACRGASAQWLLDLLQDVSFSNCLRKRLLTNSTPRCFPLTGLKQERLVAGGSFGNVYTGFLCGQSVTVEMMRIFEQSDIDVLLKEFGREALIWRQLSHPNLLPFYGLYYFQNRLCLVLPWMENGHIRAFLKKKTYDTDFLLSRILDIALGLQHLHAEGVVHGDLKGDNIFVTPSHRACIADFGLSSIIASLSSIQLTNSSKRTQGGTIRYQAPELHRGGHNDQCSDIYSFACVVYEVVFHGCSILTT